MKKKWILAALMIALSVQTQVYADDIDVSMEGEDILVEEMDGGEYDLDFSDGYSQEVDEAAEVTASEAVIDAENFQETVLFENDICTLTLTGLEPEQEDGYAWDISFENKTGGEVMFFFDSASVNDYMMNVMKDMDENVPGGGTVEDKLIFLSDSLEENQISEFAEAELTLYVTSYENYSILVQDAITVSYSGTEDVQTDNGESQPVEGETVLAQTDDYLIKIKETENDEYGHYWNVYLENNSDRAMQAFMENVTIDGLVCDPYWSSSVGSGKKLNDVVSWYEYMLEDSGVSEVTEVEGTLSVILYDEDYADYTEENYPIHLYPQGEEAAKEYERTPVDGEYTVLDNDSCKVVVTGREADDYGCYVNVYLENKLDKDVEIVMDSSVLNGSALANEWGVLIVDIPAGKRANTQAYWGNEDLELIGITDSEAIESIDVTMHIYEYEGYAEIATEQISLVGAE